MFVRNIRTFDVDEIDTRSYLFNISSSNPNSYPSIVCFTLKEQYLFFLAKLSNKCLTFFFPISEFVSHVEKQQNGGRNKKQLPRGVVIKIHGSQNSFFVVLAKYYNLKKYIWNHFKLYN